MCFYMGGGLCQKTRGWGVMSGRDYVLLSVRTHAHTDDKSIFLAEIPEGDNKQFTDNLQIARISNSAAFQNGFYANNKIDL